MQRDPFRSLWGKYRVWMLERRRRKYLGLLRGSGIEIGARQRPCWAPQLEVRYVDKLTRAESEEDFPELEGESVVETDIVDDAQTLETLSDESQDFVISSHVIEHLPNPLASLLCASRVLRPGGRMFLAVPDKHRTFDCYRQITPLQHLIDDYVDPSRERDHRAFEDWALNVVCRYHGTHPESEYKALARELRETNYSIHYHVWDYPSFLDFLRYAIDAHPESRLHVVDSMKTFSQEFIFVLEKQ